MKKNLATVSSFIINSNANFTEEKKKWIKLLDEYEHFPNDSFIHPLFGSNDERTDRVYCT